MHIINYLSLCNENEWETLVFNYLNIIYFIQCMLALYSLYAVYNLNMAIVDCDNQSMHLFVYSFFRILTHIVHTGRHGDRVETSGRKLVGRRQIRASDRNFSHQLR